MKEPLMVYIETIDSTESPRNHLWSLILNSNGVKRKDGFLYVLPLLFLTYVKLQIMFPKLHFFTFRNLITLQLLWIKKKKSYMHSLESDNIAITLD